MVHIGVAGYIIYQYHVCNCTLWDTKVKRMSYVLQLRYLRNWLVKDLPPLSSLLPLWSKNQALNARRWLNLRFPSKLGHHNPFISLLPREFKQICIFKPLLSHHPIPSVLSLPPYTFQMVLMLQAVGWNIDYLKCMSDHTVFYIFPYLLGFV